jgi:hypothetical protein
MEQLMIKTSPNEFLITDPLAQLGVVQTVPEGVEIVDLDDVPYRAEPQVNCAFCRQHQRHNDGYFAVLSNGQLAPCGNCCAANFDNVKKQAIDKDRRRLKRERGNRIRATALKADIDVLAHTVEKADQILCDGAARLQSLSQIFSDEAVFDMENHGVAGLNILDGCSAGLALARGIFNSIKQLDGITENEKKIYVARKDKAVSEVRKAEIFLQAYDNFFHTDNLDLIETWAESRGKNFGIWKCEVRGTKLHCKTESIWRNIDLPSANIS